MTTQIATVKKPTYEGYIKSNHKDEENEEDENVTTSFRESQSPTVTSATNSDRNIGITKINPSKGSNPEDDKNVAQSRRQRNIATSTP